MPDNKTKKKPRQKWRTVYFRDENSWKKVEEAAAKQDRTVNYILEKLVKDKL